MRASPQSRPWARLASLLLQEVKKHYLPHKFFGKVCGAYLLGGKFRANGFVFFCQRIEFVMEIEKECLVLFKKFLCDGLDTKGILNLCERG